MYTLTNLIFKGQTFEELCRAHIKAFSVGSERYAIDTHLSRRINEWQTKISPILQEEKNRTEFDVHEYGRRIICSIKEDMEIKRRKMKRKGQKNIELVSFKFVFFAEYLVKIVL